MSVVDRIIGIFNPKAEFSRAQYRQAIQEMRKYDAAAKGRRTSDWKATGASANAETYESLKILRDRSREKVRNNPYARKALGTIVRNTIGTGIRPRPMVSGPDATALMTEFNAWADSTMCDYDGRKTFYGLQRLIMRTVSESGAALVMKRVSTDRDNPLQLQVLEPDYIDLLKESTQVEGTQGDYIVQGIQFNSRGQRTGYWLYDRHPGDYQGSILVSKFRKAEDVLHIFRVDRPGQCHGIPDGTAAMLRLKDFDDYEDAQLVRQKIAACFSVFVQDANPELPTGSASADGLTDKIQPGAIQRLDPGKTVTFASPPGAEGYSDYARKILQAISAGYEITYESMTGDLSGVNFSSGRMGWLEAQRYYSDNQQDIIIPLFCDPVWSWWTSMRKITKSSKADTSVQWTPPRREMIDPVKETQAIIAQIRAGLTSWQESVREQGYDPDTLIAQMVEDFKKFDDNEIVLDSDPRQPAAQPAAATKADVQKADG